MSRCVNLVINHAIDGFLLGMLAGSVLAVLSGARLPITVVRKGIEVGSIGAPVFAIIGAARCM